MVSKLVEEFVIDGVIVEHLTTIKDINVYRTKESCEDYFLFFCDGDNVLTDININTDIDTDEIIENITTYGDK